MFAFMYNALMPLFQHQKDGIDQVKERDGIGAFFWDVGCGKTLAALKVYEHYKSINPDLKLFVVCPVSLIESAWGEDIEKFTKLTYANLRNGQDLNADVLIVNFECLISKKFAAMIKQILDMPSVMCVIDESQRIKSYNGKTTKYLLAMSPRFKYRLILSATPAPNTQLEYWSQMNFLDPKLFNSNYFAFRNRFFCLRRGKSDIFLSGLGRKEITMMMQRGYRMELIPGERRTLSTRMSKYCQFIDKREALDLPDEIDVIRPVEMTKPQDKAFRQMQRDLVTEIENEEIAVPNALAKLMKLRQIAAGFAYNSEGKAVELKPNPKMTELMAILEEIGNKKVIIFCQYKWTIRTLYEKFEHKAVTLYSETKNKDENIKWFKGAKDGYLIAHPLSAGVGLSFNDCDYMIFYSLDYSYMNYHQCRGRIMRANKKNNATYIHLVAENSLDRLIMESLKRKHSENAVFQNIIRSIKKGKKWKSISNSRSGILSG